MRDARRPGGLVDLRKDVRILRRTGETLRLTLLVLKYVDIETSDGKPDAEFGGKLN